MVDLPNVLSRTVLALGLIAAPLAAGAADLAEIKERGYMSIATEDNYAPFEIMEGDTPTGFTHDMVAALKEYAPFEIRQDILPWSGLLAAVRAGKYDAAITGSIISPERLRVFDFAVPTASAQHYYIKRADDDRIAGIADLDGLTVGVQAGSVLLSRLPELEAMLEESGGSMGRVVEYTSYPEIYEDLKNGRLDYTVNSIISAKSLIAERGDEFTLGEPVSGPGFHAYPVPKGNEELLDFINGFILEMKESGKLAELQEKWFGQAFPDLPAEPITSVETYEALTRVD
ncbi:transporter substrate-binding domain-containing protein [Acuticoccus sp. I52.16.1]|uniref:transporter substrate-binding domain-containing protein n=1 Tax=Acuticoccus sp. I52.16.1 TaxID=2928472 RepID=UPI001FD59782|nr:transporter substrate-binding domain-containing protein [Acuticoccus sp. I52.16.1]UOM34070.1 transporter substrate-binding domain-containing protein [Acuticoccus sp. I52.16.1]